MDDANGWFEEAEHNLELAEIMAQHQEYAMACFLCQQAVEMALKALLLFQKNEFPKTHSLRELASKAGVFSQVKELIALLEEDYTSARYFDAAGKHTWEAYDEERFERRFPSAKEALELIKKWIND